MIPAALIRRIEADRMFLCLSYDPADKRGWTVSIGSALQASIRIPEIVEHGATPEKVLAAAERRMDAIGGKA